LGSNKAIIGGANYFERIGDLGGGGFFDDFDRSSFAAIGIILL
jgi:hypothetical protein